MEFSFKEIVDNDFSITERYEQTPSSMQHYHYHNTYEIYYLRSGERYYFIKDKTFHIKKGDLVLIKEYVTHCTAAAKNVSYDRVLISFKKNFLNETIKLTNHDLYECFNKNIYVIHLNSAAQADIENTMYKMLDEYRTKASNYELYLKSYLIQILLLTKRHIEINTEYNNEYINSTHKTVSEAIGYINNNFSDEITLESISKECYVSTYYFSRIFKNSTGITFVEYLNSVRIKEAQKLLATTKLSINEISEQVGYNNSVHFWRIFKKISGVSPSEYRKLDNI